MMKGCTVDNLKGCCQPKDSGMAEAKSQQQESGGAGAAREDDVEALVNDILKDPSINISVIPDSVERLIYKSTIQLTLNVFYSIIGGLEGTKFMAHQLHLTIVHDDEIDDEKTKSRSFALLSAQNPTSDIDDFVLEEVAARLLANKAINQRFLPDRIEHMLYTNCLKVVFRMLDILTGSLRVTVCGHDIGLFLEPAAWQELLRSNRTTSSLSEIDQERLRAFARHEAGISEELGFWDSIFVPKDFVARLHASLYALILGIVDDMLANTKIEILSDKMTLDIVPAAEEETVAVVQDTTKPPAVATVSVQTITAESHTETTASLSCSNRESDHHDKVAARAVIVQDGDSQQSSSLSQQLESAGFDAERKIILQRFQEMTPDQRKILAEDLNTLLLGDEEKPQV